MGTYYTIHFWCDHELRPGQLDKVVDELLDRFEDEVSNWRKGSWINRFNVAPAGVMIPAPDHAFDVLGLCLELAERSGGMLDPTLAPLIDLWGFGTQKSHGVPPDDAAIQTALKRVGYRNLQLDVERQSVLKLRDGLEINCSAVAKGYAVDLIGKLLLQQGIENYLINIGGELSGRGTRLDGSYWKVGIRQPGLSGHDAPSGRSIELHDRCLATSGHSQRAFVLGGRRYSHILNPITGQPVPTDTASATVLASNCALADGLATLALIMDDAQMRPLLAAYPEVEVIRMPWAESGLSRNGN